MKYAKIYSFELTLIIELIVLEKSKQEIANLSYCVFVQAYMCISALTWLGTSPHILPYTRLTCLLITSSLIFSLRSLSIILCN